MCGKEGDDDSIRPSLLGEVGQMLDPRQFADLVGYPALLEKLRGKQLIPPGGMGIVRDVNFGATEDIAMRSSNGTRWQTVGILAVGLGALASLAVTIQWRIRGWERAHA